jgi:POT family proton-dependent oligopeptide transporter
MATDAAPVPDARFLGHPRGLFYLAFSEAWERFSFSGMQTLLVLYMVSQLFLPGHVENIVGFAAARAWLEHLTGPMTTQALASAIFGLYAGAVYFTPILGGIIADRWLGRRPAVILGGLMMTAGHFLMAFEQPFLLALLFLILGCGLFKGNIATQVGALYAPDDPKRASAFQVFLLGINAGVIVSPLVCGTLGETVGWHYGFGAAGVGMVVGLVIYLAGHKYMPPELPRTKVGGRVPLNLSRRDKTVLAFLLALLPVLAIGAVANLQIYNVYMVWARDNANLVVMGHHLPLTWLVTLDAVLNMIVLVSVLAFWRMWAKRRPEPQDLTKLILGTVVSAMGPLLLMAASAASAATGVKVGLGVLVVFHILNSIGFVNVYPVALALYSRLSPAPLSATIIGVFYLQMVMGSILVGWLGGLLDKLPSVQFWGLHAALIAASAAILFLAKLFLGGLLLPPPAPSTDPA